MKFTCKKYPANEVILFYTKRELTDEEKGRGLTLNEYDNVPTDNEFIDQFAALVRQLGLSNYSNFAIATGIEEKQLNTTIRTLTGQTINEWINHYIMLGIYELLQYTDKEIQEVSNLLGFTQHTVFSKFCKKQTKRTPKELRCYLRKKAQYEIAK